MVCGTGRSGWFAGGRRAVRACTQRTPARSTGQPQAGARALHPGRGGGAHRQTRQLAGVEQHEQCVERVRVIQNARGHTTTTPLPAGRSGSLGAVCGPILPAWDLQARVPAVRLPGWAAPRRGGAVHFVDCPFLSTGPHGP